MDNPTPAPANVAAVGVIGAGACCAAARRAGIGSPRGEPVRLTQSSSWPAVCADASGQLERCAAAGRLGRRGGAPRLAGPPPTPGPGRAALGDPSGSLRPEPPRPEPDGVLVERRLPKLGVPPGVRLPGGARGKQYPSSGRPAVEATVGQGPLSPAGSLPCDPARKEGSEKEPDEKPHDGRRALSSPRSARARAWRPRWRR